MFGCASAGVADATWSATTSQRQRDERIAIRVMTTLHDAVLADYDYLIGLELQVMHTLIRPITVIAFNSVGLNHICVSIIVHTILLGSAIQH